MSPALDLTRAQWIKSSYSDANGGECVEFSPTFAWVKSSYSDASGGQCIEMALGISGLVPVRDSKNPDGPTLVFPAADWSTFVAALKRADFPAS